MADFAAIAPANFAVEDLFMEIGVALQIVGGNLAEADFAVGDLGRHRGDMLARESVGSNGRMEVPGFPQEFARTRTRRAKARRQENQSDRFR